MSLHAPAPGKLTHKSVDQGIRSPLCSGEKLVDRVHYQLSDIAARPELVRSFFRHPGVAFNSDCEQVQIVQTLLSRSSLPPFWDFVFCIEFSFFLSNKVYFGGLLACHGSRNEGSQCRS